MKESTFKTRSYLFAVIVLLSSLATGSGHSAEGYATRYWDGCKPHCSWADNTSITPVKTCNINNQDNGDNADIASACNGGDAFTCWDMAPKRISDTLSYGYAAVPASGDICGKCYQLTFTGKGKYNDLEPGSQALKAANKTMIVMATNIGYDVHGGQFDLLIPGGGVGAFNACSNQWGVSDHELGAQYGGFLTSCQSQLGYSDTEALKSCVRNSCDSVFSDPSMDSLKQGCYWYLDWFEMADNPMLEYEEVACPTALLEGALPHHIFAPADDGNGGDTGGDNGNGGGDNGSGGGDNGSGGGDNGGVETGQLSCTIDSSDAWNSGFVVNATITNNSQAPVSGWKVELTYPYAVQLSNAWSSQVTVLADGLAMSAENVSHNGNLAVGGSTSFGMQGTHAGDFAPPSCSVVSQ
ncbi:cellulose binding domain-containing protein [Aliagarivorans marinus]|uniref:cellulose binding domain-containing protein n=1 Tax=Aliagarivorans marinus TaxID=561965 RepID=UPI0004152D9F|nr:cellulose binding domain-containing protein [Aliagarivorans marinus]